MATKDTSFEKNGTITFANPIQTHFYVFWIKIKCIIIIKGGRVQRPDAVFVWLRSDMLTKILTGSTGNGLKN